MRKWEGRKTVSRKGATMKYIYTAVLTPSGEDGRYFARVPDLPSCITSGKDLPDAIDMITDAASGWLVVAEDEGMPIAPPTAQRDIPRDADSVLSLITIDTLRYRTETDTRAVRKNVSLPAWMAAMAEKRNINCSQVLQDALRGLLGT